MKKNFPFKPVLIALGGVILAYALLGFFAVPAGMRKALDSAVRQELDGTFSAESVRFNPFTLVSRIQGLEIKTGQNGPFFTVQSILVDLSAASLFKLAPVISAVTIDSPKLTLSLDRNGKPVLPDRLGKSGSDKKEEGGSAVFGFSVSNISLIHGTAELQDPRFQRTHEILELTLEIPTVSTLDPGDETPVHATASFSLNQAPIRMDLSGNLFGPKVTVQAGVSCSKMSLTPWLPYIPLPEKLELTPPGVLSWDLTFGMSGPGDGKGTGQKISVAGTAGLKDLAVNLEGQGPLGQLPGLTVKVDSPDLLKSGLRLTLVSLDQPEVFLVRDASGLLPLEGLLPKSETQPAAEPAATTSSMPIALDRVECKGAKVHLRDAAVEGGFNTEVAPVSIELEGLSILGDRVDLSATGRMETPAGETLSLSGRLGMDKGITKAEGHLTLENAQPAAYDVYLKPVLGPGPTLDRVSASGDFSLTLDSDGVTGTVTNGKLDLTGAGLKGADEPVVHVPKIEVSGIDVDLADRTVRIGSLNTDQGKVILRINDQGEMNLLQQVKAIPSRNSESGDSEATWQVAVDALGVTAWDLEFLDQSRGTEPVNLSLSGIHVTADHLSTAKGAPAGSMEASMGFQKSGRITLAGPLDLAGRKARMDIGLNKIDIRAFQPYLTDYMNIDIAQGWAGAKAKLDVTFPEGKPPILRLAGEAGIGEFSSKDKVTGNDFFRCKSLFVSGMDISLNPTNIRIKDIALTDFYNRAVITESGQMNYRLMLQKKEPQTGKQDNGKEEKPGTALPPVEIENITLQGGHINFSDLFTQPNYTANMTQIGGAVSNLSTTSAEPADVVLKGVHGLYSPLDITGKIIPFGSSRMADMTLSFKNIDLIQFNAYAQKYLGYEIATGKLILNLDYHIKGDQLESKNSLFFDQFDLGKRVESKDATSLPIPLAISLLKNSKGQIDLDIPVTGNLQDPEFSFGHVVAVAFKNLILSVVSAPFKLLGKVLGGWGEGELGYVAFDPGQDRLDDNSRQKLESLAEALSQKDKLKFIIAGRYDPDLDAQALRAEKYQALILEAAGAVSEAEQKIIIESLDKRQDLVERLYAEATFPKPRDEKGKEKEIQPAEQEKLLLTNTAVTPQELAELADRRSNLILSFLVDQGLAPQRLFVQAPEAAKEEDQDGRKVKTVFKVE